MQRRAFLRGVLGGCAVALALPPLEALSGATDRAWADGTVFPRRFGLWTWANGVLPERWVPAQVGEGDAWSLSDQLAPLAAHKPWLAVVSNHTVRARNLIPHYSGAGALLTGLEQLGEEGANTYAGPTVDQIAAAQLGKDTPYRSIEAGCLPNVAEGVSFNGPHSPNPPERDPLRLFDRLFGPTFRAPGEGDVAVDPRLALRQSVLDVVGDRVTALRQQVGQRDRERLDQHLSGIRDLELRLARLAEGPPDLAACRRPDTPPGADDLPDPFGRHRALADVLALALACDLTRVVSVAFMTPVSNWQFQGTASGHHELTHNEPGDQPTVHANTVRAMEELAYFLDALRAIPEGEATLLDHCAVLGTTDVSLGKTHSLDEFPLLVAGSAGGALRTDVHLRPAAADNASKVPLTVLRAVGVVAGSYGDGDRYTTDSVTGLEA